ncbi:hypothetical protein Mp_3g25080 [Marchantia polymorpha subsp. ruderalis]|uniref:Uncharacterized protein n=2 Tax=Marchantia polymorpha TaxID=3197 RepID=A0AAF6B4J6_MARPO|nr:hypothetical protein MARPO_0100s0021 [Marchantia polymorpha]BBN06930.1 hypothetical protein Mp_3g25080 [Marchantia polymorpha subsp. ruderalis]|eukprot:PTQ32307.1 hypothetical protein MARPO_0100s0021 [Marchantia polymorpha]
MYLSLKSGGGCSARKGVCLIDVLSYILPGAGYREAKYWNTLNVFTYVLKWEGTARQGPISVWIESPLPDISMTISNQALSMAASHCFLSRGL